jgi:hypothetical protein
MLNFSKKCACCSFRNIILVTRKKRGGGTRYIETTSVGQVRRMVIIGVVTGSCRGMVRLVETGSLTLLKGVNKCVLHAFFIFIDRFQ